MIPEFNCLMFHSRICQTWNRYFLRMIIAYLTDTLMVIHIITTDYVLNLEPGKFIAVLDMKAEARNCLRVFFTFEDSRKVMATTQWWQRYLGFYEIPVGTHLLLHYRENSRKEVYLDEVERI